MSDATRMRTIRNIRNFPFEIRQLQGNYCIPANVESVNKYFKPNSPLTQQEIMSEFNRRNPPHGPGISFESIKDVVINHNPEFSWANPRYVAGSFKHIMETVKASVNHSWPPIISVYGGRVSNNLYFHALTVVGYDDTSFRVHNTQAPQGGQNPSDVPIAGIRQGLLQARSSQGRPADDSTDLLVLRRACLLSRIANFAFH